MNLRLLKFTHATGRRTSIPGQKVRVRCVELRSDAFARRKGRNIKQWPTIYPEQRRVLIEIDQRVRVLGRNSEYLNNSSHGHLASPLRTRGGHRTIQYLVYFRLQYYSWVGHGHSIAHDVDRSETPPPGCGIYQVGQVGRCHKDAGCLNGWLCTVNTERRKRAHGPDRDADHK